MAEAPGWVTYAEELDDSELNACNSYASRPAGLLREWAGATICGAVLFDERSGGTSPTAAFPYIGTDPFSSEVFPWKLDIPCWLLDIPLDPSATTPFAEASEATP